MAHSMYYPEHPNRILPPHQPRILVVDDQRSLADVLTFILNQNGFSARAVYNGTDALHECSDECWDLVLSDVEMPGIDGVNAAIAIRKLLPECKVILISGLGTEAIERALLSAKRQGYSFELIQKPVVPALLLKRIRTLLFSQANGCIAEA